MLFAPKIKLESARKLLVILIIVAASFGGGVFVGSNQIKNVPELVKVVVSRELPSNHQSLDFGLFWKVWDTINTNYYDKNKIVDSKMVYGAIKGMVTSLGDPYTVFLEPQENKVVEEDLKGSFDGVGIQIGFKGMRLAVIAPLPGSPAEKAGVKAGDFIIGIKDDAKKIDRSTDGISLPEAVEAIRGPAKSKVTLALARDGVDKPIIVEMERASIDVPSVTLSFVGKNEEIANLRVLKFSGETSAEWNEAVSKIVAKPSVKGVIVDLRNNPGGYLQASVDLASEFLKTGSTVVIEDGKGGIERPYKVERIGRLWDKPLVVMVNKGSASASEIFAGAMRDDKGTKLVGETSFGKGTIQEPLTIDGGAGIHITTARWLTPNGTWVHEKGLDPDIKVEDKADTSADEQLQEALKILE
jgi:carboxyl-terminal processing protease